MLKPSKPAPIKIAIIGPESTGKSTLSQQLASRFQTLWVPEYAREYLAEHGPFYKYDDLLLMAKRQLGLEEAYCARSASGPLFIDTEMYVMKVWCEYVFNKTHTWILDRIVEGSYDLYLLCSPDLPWEKDDLREYPDIQSRLELFNIYKDNMINQHIPWKIISGQPNQRLATAAEAVSKVLHARQPVL